MPHVKLVDQHFLIMSPKLHFILGQTGTGKTARATALTRECEGALVNCDSRQVYRKLDIITGKTDNPNDIPMHMVNVIDPKEPYSAYAYATQANNIIANIIEQGVGAIVVGGSGPYARMLLYADRAALQSTKETTSLAASSSTSVSDMQKIVQNQAPHVWGNMTESDRHNPRRLARAIEKLNENSNQHTLIRSNSTNTIATRYKPNITILLHKDTATLAQRIERRVRQRIEDGAIAECESLLAQHYIPTHPGLMTIGYQSVFRFLEGTITHDELIREWSAKERQYAKRQKTYLLKYFPQAHILFV